jgi:hypothetical protein
MRIPQSLTESIEPVDLPTGTTQVVRIAVEAEEAAGEFRHRLSVLIALIALTAVLLLVVELQSRSTTWNVLGSALTVRVSTDTLLLVLMPVLACAGVDWILRGHPDVRRGRVPFLFPYWIAPGLLALAAAALLIRITEWPLWIAVLLAGIILTAILVVAEYVALSPASRGYSAARLALTSVSYVIAFALFAMIYADRERSIISASLAVLVATALSLDLLAPHVIGLRRALIFALVIGALEGQTTWALNYWRVSHWSAGVLMLAVFYVSIGLAQQHFQDKLTQQVMIEFAVIAAVAIVVVWQLADIR